MEEGLHASSERSGAIGTVSLLASSSTWFRGRYQFCRVAASLGSADASDGVDSQHLPSPSPELDPLWRLSVRLFRAFAAAKRAE